MKETIELVSIPEVGYMRLSAVLKVFPVSASQWWKGIRKGIYPQGVWMSHN